MRLKKIVMHNIRSYVHEELEFPLGSLLLSGEAGSGKSSILLSIEFALFGFGKGKDQLTGEALMRRGTNEAFVKLVFELDGMEIEIKRTLKRKSGRVQQVSGYLKINGREEKLSPDEIKSRILQLFNYPLEFVKKGKGLPFHYTVYTKQEQMKNILLEGVEARLDTLRRVFGVDRYKIIKNNAELFTTALREKIKEKEGAIRDLPEKKEQLKDEHTRLESTKLELKKVMPELLKFKEELKVKKNELERLEKKINKFRELKEKLNTKKVDIGNFRERVKREEEEIKIIEKELLKESNELKKFNQDALAKARSKIKELSEEIEKKEDEIRKLISVLSKLSAKKERAFALKEKISKVDICPECGQKVTEEHKKEIREKANREIEDSEKKIVEIQELKKKKEEEKQKAEKEKEIQENLDRELTKLKLKLDSINEKNKRKERLEKEREELLKRISVLEKEIEELEKELKSSGKIEEDFQNARKEFEVVSEREKELEVKVASLEKVIETLSEQVSNLKKEIDKKEKQKQDMIYLKDLRDWVSRNFIAILLKIEQSVLATLHSQFDSLLKKWFSMLVEEPEITIRLSEDFSPIVEQAGFDTDYSHLSGGERTAVALAYRLALNQVINSMISQIKTRDLLILDEPTDGFSNSQLDKMRNVLEELKLKQLIIISHNPKIESFVDNVVRIRKEGHVSRIIR